MLLWGSIFKATGKINPNMLAFLLACLPTGGQTTGGSVRRCIHLPAETAE
jgi:hypothetical protein